MDFVVINNNGEKNRCNIIGMFVNDDKSFIIYTDGSQDDNEKEVYASIYKIIDNNMVLMPILDENDWNLVDLYLEGV